MSEGYVFWGGYGGQNLGDEAILWAMSQLMRRLDPGAPQSVLSPSPITNTAREQYREWNLQVRDRPLPRALLDLRSPRLIVGGGQMVDDSSYMWPVGASSLFIAANRTFGNKPLVLCVGAESLNKPVIRFLVRHVYSLAKVITCRDQESTSVMRKAGLPESKLETTRDVVFSVDRSQVPQWGDGRTDGRTVALSVAFDPSRIREGSAHYIEITRALRSQGFRIILVGHDLRPAYDPVALEHVKTAHAADPLVEIAQLATIADVFALYSQVDAVISGRMHPLIMAMLAGTLPVAYGGKAKVKSLLSITPIPSILLEGDPLAQVRQLQQALAQRAELLPQLSATMADFRRNVEASTSRALGRVAPAVPSPGFDVSIA